MNTDLRADPVPSERKVKMDIWKVVKVWAVLILISVLFPPVESIFFMMATGVVEYRFVFAIGPYLSIDWGVLVLEWLLIIGVLWLLVSKTSLFSKKS
jgi:hypothetical protein